MRRKRLTAKCAKQGITKGPPYPWGGLRAAPQPFALTFPTKDMRDESDPCKMAASP